MKNSLINNHINSIVIILLAVVSIFVATDIVQNGSDEFRTESSAQTVEPTVLIFDKISLHGIGTSGDSLSPEDHTKSNKNPYLSERKLNISIYNTSNILVNTTTGIMRYDDERGVFKSSIELADSLNGAFIIKVKVDNFLQRRIPGTIEIVKNTNITLPPVTLVAGDINGDNVLNITDLNILLGCYKDIFPPKFCDDPRETLSDISSDGRVNQLDYNLFLRELLIVQKGE
jgi:hypothetical protein